MSLEGLHDDILPRVEQISALFQPIPPMEYRFPDCLHAKDNWNKADITLQDQVSGVQLCRLPSRPDQGGLYRVLDVCCSNDYINVNLNVVRGSGITGFLKLRSEPGGWFGIAMNTTPSAPFPVVCLRWRRRDLPGSRETLM